MVEIVEIYVRWYAGRAKSQVSASLGVDRKTTRKYLADRAWEKRMRELINPVVAESLLDRLINASHQVIVNGPSCRPDKRPNGPTGNQPSN
ncbi:hypothetical protein [Streptomyces sp. NBC_00631]|uniref:hypothetical protein n=1 Tax=Streptomyces sp. NBC_00631 TaxID=2975793 RepID=UPI00386729C1